MSDQDLGLRFGHDAAAYDRGRPGYGADAVTWLTSDQPLSVLELGAGTGKLTEQLVALGHDVHATEPDEQMLSALRERLPDVRTSQTSAEELPGTDRTYDVVVAAQCFHWFDHEAVMPEIARVLKPGGRFAMVWQDRDDRIPWVKKLGRIIGNQEKLANPVTPVDSSALFDAVEEAEFGYWQTVDRRSIQDLTRSRSNVLALDEAGQDRVIDDVLALYDDYGRGMDGMQLPYRTRCFKARVKDRVEPFITPDDDHVSVADPGGRRASDSETRERRLTDSAHTLPRVVTGEVEDDAVVLIDFR